MRALTILLALAAVAALGAPTAAGHKPGTDGGPAQRGCGSISGISRFGPVGYGATRVSCSIAREVTAGAVQGRRFERWRCTGTRTRFGHCHGRGIRRGGIVHWYADH